MRRVEAKVARLQGKKTGHDADDEDGDDEDDEESDDVHLRRLKVGIVNFSHSDIT